MNTVEPGRLGAASGTWLAQLRDRFVSVARRRVAPDSVEDVVQDALRIVVERGPARPGTRDASGEPALAFCFQVLRNVIGNHYQKERVRRQRSEPEASGRTLPDSAPTPLEALAASDAVELIDACLIAMAETDPACARYLRRLADGMAPRDLAGEERVEEAALYRRVYRCRIKLRALLEQRGFFA